MFAYIKGKVTEVQKGAMVVEANDIGYFICVSNATIATLGQGEIVKVYTYMQISEANGVTLYGFYSLEEKTMFLNLIQVTGIGAKKALDVLSGTSLAKLSLAIVNGNTKELSEVKGVGKKTAERIILELKDKIGIESVIDSQSLQDEVQFDNIQELAIESLIYLGYKRQEAAKAVAKVYQAGLDVEDVITLALQSAK